MPETGETVRRKRVLNARQLETERRLIEASQKQPRRFAQLYERYFDRVYAFALTRTGDRGAAEEVTAETFRLALENLSRFQWRGVPFSAWLFRIAANVATDSFKQSAREEALPADVPEDQSWEDRLIEVETRARLFELVRRLPQDQQRVLVMRFGEEKSVREVAAEMGRSEGAIKLLQHRAIARLKSWVGDWNE
jgi:RNA polymerase sigma-70 factor (ECF subfamily)